ncbi:MAG: hypothetical protein ACOYN0_02180 [Phycisphaerales bacterium]
MAGRSSTSIGVGIALTVLSLLTLTLFVFTTVFFGKYKDRDRQVQSLQQDATEIVTAAERNRDDVRGLLQAAKESRKSLVGFLADNQGEVMEKVTGVRRDTLTQLQQKTEGVPGVDSGTLLSALKSLQSENEMLKSQVARADADRQTAITDLKNESARVASIMSTHQATIDAVNKDVKVYQGEHEAYIEKHEDYKKRVDEQLSTALTQAAEKERRLAEQVTTLTESNLILQSQIDAMRGRRNAERFRGDDEEALVDGEVIGAEGSEGKIYINLGKNQKIVLGMTFAVYADKAAIRTDDEGNYTPGKATIEVISVNENNSAARVTASSRGNPIVRGDVIANAVYDPRKTYKFVVIGNFDVNRDGIATALERQDVVSLIESWGGSVADALTGDVDFLVLGERPLVRPQPASDAPLAAVLAHQEEKKEFDHYEALHKQAISTSVPALNENRLYTLIGKSPSAVTR